MTPFLSLKVVLRVDDARVREEADVEGSCFLSLLVEQSSRFSCAPPVCPSVMQRVNGSSGEETPAARSRLRRRSAVVSEVRPCGAGWQPAADCQSARRSKRRCPTELLRTLAKRGLHRVVVDIPKLRKAGCAVRITPPITRPA